MATVVIVGAGLGGMPAAYEIKALLGKQHRVVMVNERPSFQFTPSNPWIPVGWRKGEEVSFDLAKHLGKKGIEFIAQAMTKIEPKEKYIELANGDKIEYDYLVLTTGPKLDFESIPGAGPEFFTQSVCSLQHAEVAKDNFDALVEAPGPVIVGAFQGASCFGPGYEYAFVVDKALRDAKVRKHVEMTYVTSEPYIGHLGLGGVGDSKSMMESELRNKHIKWICNARVTKVEDGVMFVEELNDEGEVKRSHELPFKHSMLIPPFKGIDPIAAVEGLANPKGFVLIDDYQRNPTYPEIYSAGVCVAIPPVEQTPVPTGTPKTGYMIESMVTAIAHNLRDKIFDDKEPSHKGTWSTVCLADMGDTGAAFVAIPQIPPRNVTWFKKGKWVRLSKIAFEKYFIRKMKSGASEPFYEKQVMKLLGVERLEK
ncbi:NAD(P)/FAD-dependent oxidoreductase [Salinibius halmophilus]|uniref:NAD(P)/FAD-dependent oxidoreductase n=1 Tax=Salinibius halmophilus TaxID=1853216 RepID=UPI000E673DC8|nr:FAD/NAD(P)-binding oxidoreductase [Salinibius halmophilus]